MIIADASYGYPGDTSNVNLRYNKDDLAYLTFQYRFFTKGESTLRVTIYEHTIFTNTHAIENEIYYDNMPWQDGCFSLPRSAWINFEAKRGPSSLSDVAVKNIALSNSTCPGK